MVAVSAPTGVITGVRVTHARATLDELEAAADDDPNATIEWLLRRDGVAEAFTLQTCNRVEAYVVTDDPREGQEALADFAPDVRDAAVVRTGHEESLRHLMCVATGLESLVLGEDQIMGQLRRAYEDAREVGGIGPMLEAGITKAIRVGERARTETKINEGSVSLGSAAVGALDEEIDLDAASALVVGAGEMGTLAARALADANVERLVIANRTVRTAELLADELDADAQPTGLDALSTAASRADIVVSATGADDYVIDRESLADAGETVLVDLARPRDIDPAVNDRSGVTLLDLDDLEDVTDDARERRQAAAERVERMIDREFERLLDRYKRRRADEVIGAMHASAERLKRREVETALTKMDAHGEVTDEQRAVIEAMADALVSKLLAAPTKSLRDAAGEDDWETIDAALRLFDPEFSGGVRLDPERRENVSAAVAEAFDGED